MNAHVQDKPFVDASAAASLLGTDRASVVADVRLGVAGSLASLVGTESMGICVVCRWELEGERLEMHRARLAYDSSVVP